MSNAEDATFSLKVMINKEKSKVLFAEVENDFIDVLLSFLTLPLGRIVKFLRKHNVDKGHKAPVVGSLTSLYDGLENLDSVYFWTEATKPMLLNPESAYEDEYRELKLSVSDNAQPIISNLGKAYEGVFTRNMASFIVSDDLRVLPDVKLSIMEALSTLGISMSDMEGAEIRNLTFGLDEIMDFLKEAFISSNPLTNLILRRRQTNSATMKIEPGSTLLHHIGKEAGSTSSSRKFILKVMLQKSTKKLLFAQADDYFIDFLFSILTIPLGRVVSLLDGNTCLKTIDNLYRSVADDFIDDNHLRSGDIKDRLIKPKLPPKMCTTNQFLPLSEGHQIKNRYFLKGSKMFMVTDDLIVRPLVLMSSFSILNAMKISLSDIEELELHVGLEEGLSILKASLTSTTALTDALINPMLKKQVKQEH